MEPIARPKDTIGESERMPFHPLCRSRQECVRTEQATRVAQKPVQNHSAVNCSPIGFLETRKAAEQTTGLLRDFLKGYDDSYYDWGDDSILLCS